VGLDFDFIRLLSSCASTFELQ